MQKKYIKPRLVFIVFSIWGILLYSNTFNSSFHYDDYFSIVSNPYIHWNELTLENVKKIFLSNDYIPTGRQFSYLTFALNYYFGGLDVSGYHIVNIFIHILTGFGFLLFLRSALELSVNSAYLRDRSLYIALIASLLWFTSPLHTQSVTYVVQRMTALAAMFYVYAMFFYLKGRTSVGFSCFIYYFLSFSFSITAFFTKQNSYVLPLFILLFEFVMFRGGNIVFFLKKRMFLIIAVLSIAFVASFWFYYYSELSVTPGTWLIYQYKVRLLTGIRVIVFYIVQLLLPIPSKLCLIHDFPISRSLFSPYSTLLTIAMVVSFLFAAVKLIKRQPLCSFFIFWFFGNLVVETFYPELLMVFEHRTYLPSMGFFALVAIGLDKLLFSIKDKWIVWLPALMILLILLLFSLNTFERNLAWKDDHTLWSDVIYKSPEMYQGYWGLASYYLREKEYNAALPMFIKARSIEPRNSSVRYGLGLVYFELKMYDKAVQEFLYLGSMGYPGGEKDGVNYYLSRVARDFYDQNLIDDSMKVLDRALYYDPENIMLDELKKEVGESYVPFEETLRK